jgi:protein Tex
MSAPPLNLAPKISALLGLPLPGVSAVLRLTQEAATVPFIARYRKEATGALDEVQIQKIQEQATRLTELEARRATILDSIAAQGLLDPQLEAKVRGAETKAELEDLYLPFKPKRRTRATIARERGLEPLALQLWSGEAPSGQGRNWPETAALAFVNAALDVADVDAALAGARDICAERASQNVELRRKARELLHQKGVLCTTKSKEHREQATKFDAYAEFREPLSRLPSHRLLAIARGEAEGVLKAKVEVDVEPLQRAVLQQLPAKPSSPWAEQLRTMASDATERLLLPSAETEVRSQLAERAEEEAIGVFAVNLRQLLLAAPFGGKRVLAIDPGQRTGCKTVALSATGKVLEHTTLYLLSGTGKLQEATSSLRKLLTRHRVQAIAIGNGTHGRETEQFVRDVLRDHPNDNPEQAFVVSVNEAGASVYSASELARQEFPELDVTVRGAISIGRRLQDPLAELVKVEPKSIGVGQYQHDVNQRKLGDSLAWVVESCVNEVGVELNTASAELLRYVAGVGPKLAQNIVAHRDQHGEFTSRAELLGVKGLGPKAFEQCAGFLRIAGAKNPLDASAVHPERYELVGRIAKDAGASVQTLIGNQSLLGGIPIDRYVAGDVGTFTLKDILSELAKPGRDPRSHFEAPKFDASVSKLTDLVVGMQLEGVVTNVTAFGAFVDVGVHQDGLVHVSELADRFVKDPATVVKVGDRVRVRVLEVDLTRKRIALSRKGLAACSAP